MNAPLVWRDPVVAEIHAVRAELAREYADDLVAYSRAAVARCRLLNFEAEATGLDEAPTTFCNDGQGNSHPRKNPERDRQED